MEMSMGIGGIDATGRRWPKGYMHAIHRKIASLMKTIIVCIGMILKNVAWMVIKSMIISFQILKNANWRMKPQVSSARSA